MSEVKLFTQPGDRPDFERYHRVRLAEGRVYTQDTLRKLPEVSKDHPHRQEWLIRQKSAKLLCRYLQKKAGLEAILDLGCGNGWMTHFLAKHLDCSVTGLDQNLPELQEAANVFSDCSRLQFGFGDIFEPIFGSASFDQIVLSSCIQYFPDKKKLLETLFGLLRKNGQIHIIDSPVYQENELEATKARSEAYYQKLGFPEMAKSYHPCTFDDLKPFYPHFQYRPTRFVQFGCRLWRRVFRPFPWIILERKNE